MGSQYAVWRFGVRWLLIRLLEIYTAERVRDVASEITSATWIPAMPPATLGQLSA